MAKKLAAGHEPPGTLKYFDTAVHSAIASGGAAQNGAAVPKIEAAAPYVPTWKFEWIAPPETPGFEAAEMKLGVSCRQWRFFVRNLIEYGFQRWDKAELDDYPFSKNCTCPVEIVREFVTHPNFDLRRDEWRVMVGLKPRPGAEPIAASAASAARTGGV